MFALVLLPDLVGADQGQSDLFVDPSSQQATTRRMDALDAINRRFGRDTLRFGGELVGSGWHRRARMAASRSTTSWTALPWVRAI
ncbi:DNA polymerase V, subunit C [Thiorhodococcus drewsii AZ1]|uniref:DNA polymerase V, subunit C n=1 Tax=Thiorhodococcus drewsii AZ1 TaxID=765913 RepID=G2E4M0_9GAMM|nr:DUF4113 domain-containing protein [Thiorhodococcus drewsii]EGV29641.1 DNA polymerase V, subunit C [Thiorhodococcus drewsii AZ1]